MSDNEQSEGADATSEPDGQCDEEGWHLSSHSLFVRTEYYRSFAYCLTWKGPMSPGRSSRVVKASRKSAKESPKPSEEVVQHRLINQRWKNSSGTREPKASTFDADEGNGHDIIDIINSSCSAEHVADRDGVEVAELTHDGLDESHEGSDSDWSIVSGPSLLQPATSKKPKKKPSQGLCSACCMLYQRARRAKAPIKDKLLDNDPKSLACDQWVLIKKWKPRRLPDARWKPLNFLQLLQEISVKQKEQRSGAGRSSACTRPRIFLQRNLRRCVGVQSKKERKKKTRKRRRKGSQGSHDAKQQRLHTRNHRKQKSINCMDDRPSSCFSSCAGFVDGSNQEISHQADADLTAEEIPSSTEPRKIQVQQKAPQQISAFQELLAKMRCNTSMIVKEKY